MRLEFLSWCRTRRMPKQRNADRTADIAIDQLYAGWYGGFAVEVMAMGKTCVAYSEEDREFVPGHVGRDADYRIAADTIEEDLARILDQRADWPAIRTV